MPRRKKGTTPDVISEHAAETFSETVETPNPKTPEVEAAVSESFPEAQSSATESAQTPSAESDEIDIVVTPVKRRGRKPKATVEPATVDNQAITVLLTLLESFGALVVDPETAQLNASEKLLLNTALPELLKTISPEVMTRVNGFLYPGMLVTALGMYGMRIVKTRKAHKQEPNVAVPVTAEGQSAETEEQVQAQSPDVSQVPNIATRTFLANEVRGL